jgi:hypothetical protein
MTKIVASLPDLFAPDIDPITPETEFIAPPVKNRSPVSQLIGTVR